MSLSLYDAVDYALTYAEKIGAYQAEAFGARGKAVILNIEKGIPSITTSYISGIAVRVATKTNYGFSYTTSLSKEAIEFAVKTALEGAKAKGDDKYFKSLPEPLPATPITPFYDTRIAEITADEIMNLYEIVRNNVIASREKIMLIGGGMGAVSGETILKNSLGIEFNTKRTLFYCYLYCLSTDEIPPAVGFAVDVQDSLGKVKLDRLSDKVIEDTVKSKRAKEMDFVGKADIVIMPHALSSFLWVFSEEIAAHNVDRNNTPFKRDMIGNKIADENLSIIDNPRSPDCPWRTDRDDEGVPTKSIEIIRDGILKSFLTDWYYAKKWNVEPTGSCRRISAWSYGWNPFVRPTIAPSWIEIKHKNEIKYDEIISEIREGFVIKSVMGIHQSDFASGRFAVPASGWYIKNGEIKMALRSVMLAGTIPELLKNVKATSKEKERTNYGDLPSVHVQNVYVTARRSPFMYRFILRIINGLIRLGIIKSPIVK